MSGGIHRNVETADGTAQIRTEIHSTAGIFGEPREVFQPSLGAKIHGHTKPRQRYILNGHASGGISGGPVWHYSTDRDRAEVIGLIVRPGFTGKYTEPGDMPGYIDAEPINPAMFFIDARRQDGGDFVITDCRPESLAASSP